MVSKRILNSTIRKITVGAILACIPCCSEAQKIDSLKKELNKASANSSKKVFIYAALAKSYRGVDPDSMKFYATNGIKLANELKDVKGKAACMNSMALYGLIMGQPDTAIAYANKAIKLLAQQQDSAAMAEVFYYLAAGHYIKSDFANAIEHYKTSAKCYDSSNLERTSDILNNLGITYSTLGQYPLALTYYLEALKIRERINDTPGITLSLGDIGRIYSSLKKHQQALSYITKCLELQKYVTDKASRMSNFENAGNVYLMFADTTNAISVFKKAIDEAQSANLVGEVNRIRVNLAETYIAMGRYDEAAKEYKLSAQNNESIGSPAISAMIMRGEGRILVHDKKINEGVKRLKAAADLFEENGMMEHKLETLLELSSAYELLGDYRNAYQIVKQQIALKDTLNDNEINNKVQQLQYDYELDKKQATIKLLEKDKLLAQSKSDKKSIVLIVLIVGFVVVIGFLIVVYRSRMREKKSKQLIEIQAQHLTTLNNYKDKVFSVLSHDIRDPIGSLSTAMTLLDEDVISKDDFLSFKNSIQNQLSSVTLLIDNLLKWSGNQFSGHIKNTPSPINIKSLFQLSIDVLKNQAAKKHVEIVTDISESLTAYADTDQVDIIIRNIIINAIKFSHQQGVVTINGQEENNMVSINIIDAGVGMSREQLNSIFSTENNKSTRGTMGEKGTGLGLIVCAEFAKANNGTLTATSNPDKGSTFTLTLPKA